MSITSEVLDFCRDSDLFPGGGTLLCCVSGGADSMALLHLFHENGRELGLSGVACAHLNHGLRGAESDGDEEFVSGYCRERGIPLFRENARLSEAVLPPGTGMEEHARRVRYDFFERAAEQAGASFIATGHTLDDNAETVLFRLARGTGLKGAAGIPIRRDRYVRPLLCLTREQTEAYCREHGIDFRTDSTNESDGYARNRLRHHAMPALRTVNPRAAEAVCAFASDAGQAFAYLSARAEELLRASERGGKQDAEALRAADPLIRRYTLIRMLEREGFSPDRETVARCGEVLERTGKLLLATNLQFVCRKDVCYADSLPRWDRESAPVEDGKAVLRSGRGVVLEDAIVPGKFTKAVFKSTLDYDKVIGDMHLRHRLPGDAFRPAGRGCAKSLKDLFSEKKLTNREKSRLLVLCDREGILWLEGEGIAERVRTGPDTRRAVAVTVTENMKKGETER